MYGHDAHAGNTGEMLLALLRAERAECARVPSLLAWDAVAALALRHGVAQLLHRRLQAGPMLGALPPPLADRLEEERRAIALDNLRNYGEFGRVAHALRAAGIPLVALKGIHLAELVYRDISMRPMSDIDILVRQADLERAVVTLQRIGYGSEANIASAAAAMVGTKCNIGLAHRKREIWLELHWALDEPRTGSTDPLPEIWCSALSASLGDAETLVMSPEFLLLHVCAHLACNHNFAFSLRALCDIAEIVHVHPTIDWEAVVIHGCRHHWTRGVAAALRLARDHLGVPVPEHVLAALGSNTLDPGLLADAIAQLLAATELPEGLVTAPNLIALSGSKRLREKAAMMWRRLFVPRAELALLYGVPRDSPRLPLYYAIRLRDLAQRYAAAAWALNAGDPALAEVAARHVRLQRWITGGPAHD